MHRGARPIFWGLPHGVITDHATRQDTWRLGTRHWCAYKSGWCTTPPRKKMKSFLARASGATLGFIADNTRGARLGYRMAKYAVRRRPAKRARSTSKAPPPAKRRRIVHSSHAVRRAYTRKKAGRSGKRRKGRSNRSSAAAKTGGSYFSLGAGPRLFPGFKRTQQPTTFISTATQRVSCGSSQQTAALLPTWQINAGLNAEDTLDRSQFWVDAKLLERAERWLSAYQLAPATAIAGTTTASRIGARATMKFVVNYIRYDQMFRNMSTQDADIILYDCVLRNNVTPNQNRNEGLSPIMDWEQGLTNERNPSRELDSALANPSALIGTPGTTPFMSQAFCKLYRIVKVTKKTLSSGEVHHHRVTIRPRQMFDNQTTWWGGNDDGQNQSSGLQSRGLYLPGISGFTILVASGSIMGRQIGGTIQGNDIALSQVAIDCVTKTSASFAQFSRERRMHLQFDGLAKVIASELAGPQDDAGVIQVGDPMT